MKPISRKVKDRHVDESTQKRTSSMQKGREDPIRDRLVAARLYITDVSKGGVKVIAEYLDIPPEFTIIFSTGDPRQCRLAWRIGCELGAQFID